MSTQSSPQQNQNICDGSIAIPGDEELSQALHVLKQRGYTVVPPGVDGLTASKSVHSSFYDLHMTNTSMSKESSVVYRQTQEILESYFSGIPLSANLSILERSYQVMFKRSLHYQSLGVKNLEDLVGKMGKRVVVFEKNKHKFVMSARLAETRLKDYLKPVVQELFNRHCDEIKFDSFEHFYKEFFHCKLCYYFYGLTNLDHLCEVLNDILEVGVNRSGEKVIKPKPKPVKYNLRKRKYRM